MTNNDKNNNKNNNNNYKTFLGCDSFELNLILIFRVTIHNKITKALTDEFGLDVQPSTATNIGVQQVTYGNKKKS